MSSTNPVRRAMLLGVLLAAAALLVEQLVVSDEERLEQHLDLLAESFSSGNQAAIDALLADSFSYAGPRPVGEGDRSQALQGLDNFWLDTDEPSLGWRSTQITIEGMVGRVEASGTVRFRYGGSLIVYRADAVMDWSRAGDGWQLRRLDLPLLRPGIF